MTKRTDTDQPSPANPPARAERFADPGDSIETLLADEILVECPRCGCCAAHRPIAPSPEGPSLFAPRRLVCPHCALTRDWHGHEIQRCWAEVPARDDYFGAVLWVRGAFGSKEIWAYNWRHLELIERYVAARHRTRARSAQHGWSNRSVFSRLPAWVKSSGNREAVLATIDRIRRERSPGA